MKRKRKLAMKLALLAMTTLIGGCAGQDPGSQAGESVEVLNTEVASQMVQTPEPTPETAPAPTPTPTPEPTPIPKDFMIQKANTILEEENKLESDFAALAETDTGTNKKIDEYVASLQPSKKNGMTGLFEGKNLIFISAEAFTAEVIREDLTPTLYRLATKGIQFTDFYQPAGAGTTGGECQNIFGLSPVLSGTSVKITADYNNYFTMGSQLNRLGYYGKAYHNGNYTTYDRDKTHNNLGYSEGFMAYGNGMEKFIVPTWPESDHDMFIGTIPDYIDQEHFNIYYMSVSGHSNYGFKSNAMAKKHKDRVADMEGSTPIRAYEAANLDFEDALAYLVGQLEEKGIEDDTVIVISADHYPYGLDGGSQPFGKMPYLSELYGYDVTNIFERDHNRLIIWCGCLEEFDPIVVDSPVCSIDILPTLSNLFGTEWDSRLFPGRDVFSDAPVLEYLDRSNWKTDLGICIKGKFKPFDEEAELPENYVKTMSAMVSKKYEMSKNLLSTDYFGHLYELGLLK
ncbi:MAG: LTA synthase family protein [Lachnospiraceae bacterium]|nr:LTA synthase family protein [Lachnospiraceae bacterium]